MNCITNCTGSYKVKDPSHITDTTTNETYGNDSECEVRGKFMMLAIFGHAILLPLHLTFRICDLFTGGFIQTGSLSQSLIELATRIVKITLLPFGFIARIFIALTGIFTPYPARKCYIKIEQFFYVSPRNKFEKGPFLGEFLQFNAPCMQTCEFRRQENIYRYNDDYDRERAQKNADPLQSNPPTRRPEPQNEIWKESLEEP